MIAQSDAAGALIAIFFYVIWGVACAAIANSRGRNAAGWFFIGVFTSCIGLILVLVLPDLKVQEAERRRQEQENRRLKEQAAAAAGPGPASSELAGRLETMKEAFMQLDTEMLELVEVNRGLRSEVERLRGGGR